MVTESLESDNPHKDYLYLLEYWQGKFTSDGSLPTLTDIELMDLWTIASNMTIIDIERAKNTRPRYRWRYAGSNIRQYIGMEITNKYLEDVCDPQTVSVIEESYDWICREKKPHYWRRKLDFPNSGFKHRNYERGLVPLIGDTAEVDHILGVYIFEGFESEYELPQLNADERVSLIETNEPSK